MDRTLGIAQPLKKETMLLIEKKKGFTLTELVIGFVLTGLIILVVTTVDIFSHRYFSSIKKTSRVQDEVKIAMEDIVKNLQRGIGDMTNPGTFGSPPGATNSRGFYILDPLSQLATGGGRIQIKLDDDDDGKFDSGTDRIVEYSFQTSGPMANIIVYRPDISIPGNQEPLTDAAIVNCSFSIDGDDNRVEIIIIARYDPSQPVGLDNPETILTSSTTLRAMSIN